ncbi:FadR/GntR family transcriptional regulator [Compostimonas suwonensis]|uniref:GntR family transcriptional repressor for pyruvate dehydrogenase complex n=1 Tax=Compostimonas suwonensis TaxID=1048394 RepID=A0A2M9C094_9MICO|nr:FCD domain-containing protein [Compostimonas suwonensis]PJJ63767.1 GntR family transcriptional repressor for pyruvate dehydrogenase complex [Compostimonas suwonensis]
MRLEDFVERLLALSSEEGEMRGARLPPERELGERLQISRGALREQLSILDGLGFLERTQGRGSYLHMPNDEFVRTFFTVSRQVGYIDDDKYAEARMMIEETVAAGAAERASDEQIAALRELVDTMIASTRAGDYDAALEADVRFHSELTDIIDNPIFRFLEAGLSHVLHETIQYRRQLAIEVEEPDADGIRKTDKVHYTIVDAIAAHDPDRARQAMREHFEDWRRLGFPDSH